jgi:hypothetical protein
MDGAQIDPGLIVFLVHSEKDDKCFRAQISYIGTSCASSDSPIFTFR